MMMWRTLFVAFGFWVARSIFHRPTQAVDKLTRLRNAGF